MRISGSSTSSHHSCSSLAIRSTLPSIIILLPLISMFLAAVCNPELMPINLRLGGQGKDSNLRYDLRCITTLASCCLKPLSHLSQKDLAPISQHFLLKKFSSQSQNLRRNRLVET